MKLWHVFSAAALTILAGMTVALLGRYRVNLTPSSPPGIYQLTSKPDAYAEICSLPGVNDFAADRGYIRSRTECLIKPILGVPGDRIHFDVAGFWLNGLLLKNTAPLACDTKGRPLVHLAYGNYVVTPETVWLVSTFTAMSFDSRYFGPIPVSKLTAHARPVWLF